MKLGTETGSLVNHLFSRAVVGQPEPKVGMGATVLGWTDRHAATVVAVIGPDKRLTIRVQEDKATRVDKNGMSESQEYTYEADPNGSEHYFRRAPSGMWVEVVKNRDTGRWNKIRGGGKGLRLGERASYHDYSF